MSTGVKIQALCDFKGIKISRLENDLNFSKGSINKNDPNKMQSDRLRDIAKYFDVTPTYLQTDMVYCVCPTCGVAYDPLNEITIESHESLHKNFITLREKVGYLLNLSEAATKRAIAETFLEKEDIPDDGKVFHYETLIRCDYSDYAYENNFIVNISYSDFIKNEILEKKYFNLISDSVIKNLMVKYNIDPNESKVPLIDMFKNDKEFMSNITDLWDLPQELRYDVYKAIRHAKRDYADKEYYTNPYANTSKNCHDNYDPNSEKCKSCRKGIDEEVNNLKGV